MFIITWLYSQSYFRY